MRVKLPRFALPSFVLLLLLLLMAMAWFAAMHSQKKPQATSLEWWEPVDEPLSDDLPQGVAALRADRCEEHPFVPALPEPQLSIVTATKLLISPARFPRQSKPLPSPQDLFRVERTRRAAETIARYSAQPDLVNDRTLPGLIEAHDALGGAPTIVLARTRVSGAGLASLAELSWTIRALGVNPQQCDAAGIENLKRAVRIQRLYISGACTQETTAKLEAALPNTVIAVQDGARTTVVSKYH